MQTQVKYAVKRGEVYYGRADWSWCDIDGDEVNSDFKVERIGFFDDRADAKKLADKIARPSVDGKRAIKTQVKRVELVTGWELDDYAMTVKQVTRLDFSGDSECFFSTEAKAQRALVKAIREKIKQNKSDVRDRLQYNRNDLEENKELEKKLKGLNNVKK